MTSPQKENGYTAIANEIMEELAKRTIRSEVRSIVDVVIRKTYGFNKKEDTISITQFEKATGMKRANICRATKRAVVARLLLKNESNYKFNKNYNDWLVAVRLPAKDTSGSSRTDNLGSSRTDNQVVAVQQPTKDTITKDTITKDIATAENTAGIQKIFDIFYKTINPTINFGNKTNRNATLDLIKQFGLEAIIKITKYACKVQSQQFAPVITTPYQLKEKMAQLKIFADREKSKKIKISVI